MSEEAQFRLFWFMAALALLVAALFIEVGCSDPERDYQEAKFANDTFQLKQDLAEKQAKGEAELKHIHAQEILGMSAHEQVALKAQGLSAKLQGALWILGISLALNLAGGFFLASIMPSLSVTLFKMAALCAVLIGLDVAADFLLPYVVEYIGWAALAIPLAIAGVIAYEVKRHPSLLDFLKGWHLMEKAETAASKLDNLSADVQEQIASAKSGARAAEKRAEALSAEAGQSMIDSGTFPQQHVNGRVPSETALSPKTPQRRKD